MQKPTSDAHSNTYSINANFEGISYSSGVGTGGRRKFRRVLLQSQLQVASGGSARLQKVPEGSSAGSGASCTQYADYAGSAKFNAPGKFRSWWVVPGKVAGHVPEGSVRSWWVAPEQVTGKVPEGSGLGG